MAKNKLGGFVPVLIFYFLLNAFFVFGKEMVKGWGVDANVVGVGNALLFLITAISFSLAKKGMSNPNPHAFIRSVYVSVMLKLFVCMIAASIYIFTWKSHLNKPALFICMGLYLVYTFMEVAVLMKVLKQKTNA